MVHGRKYCNLKMNVKKKLAYPKSLKKNPKLMREKQTFNSASSFLRKLRRRIPMTAVDGQSASKFVTTEEASAYFVKPKKDW